MSTTAVLTLEDTKRVLRSWRWESNLSSAIGTTAASIGAGSLLAWSAAGICTAAVDADGTIRTVHGTIDNCFEARLFNESGELRWLHLQQGIGHAVLLCDEELSLSDEQTRLPDLGIDAVIDDVRYLCWGQVSSAGPDSLTLDENRIPLFNVPVTAPATASGSRVALKAREYVHYTDAGDAPNAIATIVEERLTGWEIGNG